MRNRTYRIKGMTVLLSLCMLLCSVPLTAGAATLGKIKPQIETGTDVSAALTENGKVYVWGYNHYGELGDGTTVQSKIPKLVEALQDEFVTDISTGQETVAAVTADGRLFTWGYNSYGQLGIGASGGNDFRSTPQLVTAFTSKPVAKVCMGQLSAAAVTKAGEVYTWGFNSYGQLGIGTPSSTDEVWNTPQKVDMPAGVKIMDVSIFNEHAAALTDDGKVYIWGYNGKGQLGDGTTTRQPTPQELTALSGKKVISISVGSNHTVALTAGGDVYLWGGNSNGQLGNGTNDTVLFPQKLDMPGVTFKQAVTKGGHTALLTRDGKVYTFGWNSEGQLGNGKTGNSSNSNVPVLVQGRLADKTVTAIDAGYTTTIVLTDNNTLYCWGSNWHGQAGVGSASSKVPSQVRDTAGTGYLDLSAAGIDQGGMAVAAKTSIPAPTYTITIPEQVDMGELTRKKDDAADKLASKELTLTASNVDNLFDEQKIAVTASAPDGAFRLTDGTNQLPYSVYAPDGTTALANEGLFTEFTGNGSKIGRVEVDQSLIRNAGTFTGTVTFTIALTDRN